MITDRVPLLEMAQEIHDGKVEHLESCFYTLESRMDLFLQANKSVTKQPEYTQEDDHSSGDNEDVSGCNAAAPEGMEELFWRYMENLR